MQPILGRKIRAAIIGCGRIANNHINAIEHHTADIELVAVCDTYAENRLQYSEKYQVPGFETIEDLVKNIACDLVIICTPSGLHSHQTIVAARAKKHVMTEKPMATRWKDGLRMVQACDEAGVYLFVIKQNRLNPTLQLLKKAIDDQRFGRINMVHINVFWQRPQDYYNSARWRGTWEMDGGALMNQASHYVDLLEWLVGPIADVQAMIATLGRNIEVEDSAVMNVRWRNGALGSMAVSMLAYPRNLEGSITILGDTGSVRIGGVAVNDIQIWDFSESRDYDRHLTEISYNTTSVYGFGHPLYYQNIIDVLRGKAEPETDGREGLKSLELIIAAYKSARDRSTISLPLEY